MVWRGLGFGKTPVAPRVSAWRVAALALLVSSCSGLEARRHARAGAAYFQEQKYAEAAREYERAEALSPGVYEVSLNHGLACRELVKTQGASAPDRERNVACAIDAFSRAAQLRPDDRRAAELVAQTLFDAKRFDALVAMYEADLERNPDDLASINALINLHSQLDHWSDVLRWAMKRARIQDKDAEAHYMVGVLIYNRLSQRSQAEGSNVEASASDQRAGVRASARARLGDLGLRYMGRAIELRPRYREPMAFMLLLRHATSGPSSDPTGWEFIDEKWFRDEEQRLQPVQYFFPSPAQPGDHPIRHGGDIPI